MKELELKYFKVKRKRQQTFSKEENITLKVLEGLISRWITRLYRIFATFPTRDPRGLPVLCSPTLAITTLRPKPRWLCLGPEEKWERHSPFLNKRTQPFSIFLQSRSNESGRSTPPSLFYTPPPHLCGTPGVITWPHCLRISAAFHFAPRGQL